MGLWAEFHEQTLLHLGWEEHILESSFSQHENPVGMVPNLDISAVIQDENPVSMGPCLDTSAVRASEHSGCARDNVELR